MPERLYPPQIAGTLPAFCKTYTITGETKVLKDIQLVIPFTASVAVNNGDFVGFSLRLRTASTNTFLFDPIESTNFDIEKSTVTFTIPSKYGKLLNEGQYYKIQIAYISKYIDSTNTYKDSEGNVQTITTFKKLIGYYSTVGIIKCIQNPVVYIQNYTIDSVNIFNNELHGVYQLSDDLDQSEKVYSYNFSFYTEDGELYYTTGELLHNNANDIEYGISTDTITLSSFIKTNEIYKLIYTVTTLNGFVASSPSYRVTTETLLAPGKDLTITTTAEPNNGCIKVGFKGKERILREENIILSMTKINTYYRYDKNLCLKIKTFYESNDFAYWVNLLSASENSLALKNCQNHIKNNLYLLNELTGIPTGLLSSLVETSRDYIIDLGSFLKNFIEGIGTADGEKNHYNNLMNFLYITIERLTVEFNDFNKLDAIIQTRVIAYLKYLQDAIKNDNTLIDEKVTNKEFINLCQNIISTVNMSTSLIKEYFTLLGYDIITEHQVDKQEETYFGQYILVRASEEDDYRSWLEIKKFKLENMRPSLIKYNDYTVKQGVKYIYGVIQYNLFGIYSSRIESEPVSVDFEDIFLYDGERILKIKFNPKVSSFKTTILEQKTNTIGNKYPFIFRNGNVGYKEFPISGLLSYQMDDELLFYDREINEYIRSYTYDSNKKNSADFFSEMEQVLENPCDLIESNIHKERDFKTEVLDWLNNGKPKLFRSGPEGNYIVRIMNVSLSPVDSLGRMLHSFTAQCVEIADFSYSNLLQYGFIQTDLISKYISMWRSYYLNDYEPIGDIILKFESNISSFSVQDMKPGSSIFLTYGDRSEKTEEEIVIGITGSYNYNNSNSLIEQIRIPNSPETHPVGILECQYQGVRYSNFDAITAVKLKTILSNQFVGVNPVLTELDTLVSEKNKITLLPEDQNRIIKAIQSINDRILLNNETYNSSLDLLYKELSKKNFEPGDILQHIITTFYNYQKEKLKILNLEQLKIKVRELIPIYAVPYEQVTLEGWNKLTKKYPDGIPWAVTNGLVTNKVLPLSDGTYAKKDYDEVIGSQYLLYSVTPFGTPYPIDELTPQVQHYYDINDEFCIFQMYEYFPKFQAWMPTQRTNIFGVKTGQYYDCYWDSVIDEYDTSFYIDDKYRYEKISDFKQDETNNFFYVIINGEKKYLDNNLNIYVKKDNTYLPIDKVFIYPKGNPKLANTIKALENELQKKLDLSTDEDQKNNLRKEYDAKINPLKEQLSKDSYFLSISNNDELINDINYLETSIKWANKEDYDSLPNYNHADWTIDQNNQAEAIVKASQIPDFYLRYENQVQMNEGEEQYFSNLGSPKVIKIGTGLIGEVTFQLEIFDYFTEENDQYVQSAKETYLKLSDFLKNLYRNYEIIAEADCGFQRYLTLTRIYDTLLQGLTENNNLPYENTNNYQSNLDLKINYQDRKLLNEILNTNQTQITQRNDIADLWAKGTTEEQKTTDKQKVEDLIRKLQINKTMYNELNLVENEENDLVDLIQKTSKIGINDKLAKITTLLKKLYNQRNGVVENALMLVQNYVLQINRLEAKVDEYNTNVYQYKAGLWLYNLIMQHIALILDDFQSTNYNKYKDDEEFLTNLESSISIEKILNSIKNHYQQINGTSDASSTEAQARLKQLNYYLESWNNLTQLSVSIATYQDMVIDGENDTELDDLFLASISSDIFSCLENYWKIKTAHNNLRFLFGIKEGEPDSEALIQYIGINQQTNQALYPYEQVASTMEKIGNIHLNNSGFKTVKDLFQYAVGGDYATSAFSAYQSLVDKFISEGKTNNLSDSDSETIKTLILYADKIESIYQASLDLKWSNFMIDSIYKNYLNQTLNIKQWCAEESAKNHYGLLPINNYLSYETQAKAWTQVFLMRHRLLNRFKYIDQSQNIQESESYLAILTSAIQENIKAETSRGLIFELSNSEEIINNSMYNSIEFDEPVYTVEENSMRAAKIKALINLIDNTCKPYVSDGYRKVLDVLSDQISYINSNSYGDKCFESLFDLSEHGNGLNNIINTYNSLIQPYQSLLINEGLTDEFIKVDNVMENDEFFKQKKYYIYENSSYKIATVFDDSVQYYMKDRDALAKMFIEYYNNLPVADSDKKNNTYNFISQFLKLNNPKPAELFGGTINLYANNKYQDNIILTANNSESFNTFIKDNKIIYPERQMIEKTIGLNTGSRLTFLNNTIGGDNALTERGTIDNIISAYNKLLDTSGTAYNLYLAYNKNNRNIFNKNVKINNPANYKITALNETDSITWRKFQYLSLLKGISNIAILYYWCNSQLFNKYRINPLLLELFTNKPTISNKPDDTYPAITSIGIFYWYIDLVLSKDIKACEAAVKQAEILETMYTNKQTLYKSKKDYYESKYTEYLQIFTGFLGSNYYEYYKSDASSKDAQMKKLVQQVKDAWNNFILELDKGYTREIKAGMYQ